MHPPMGIDTSKAESVDDMCDRCEGWFPEPVLSPIWMGGWVDASVQVCDGCLSEIAQMVANSTNDIADLPLDGPDHPEDRTEF